MQTRRGRARLSAALATFCTLVVIALPPAQAANSGGRPESFQPDLATGRLTTTISVPVPPGRHGVQPTIALQYASGSTAALAGYGWTLEVGGTERGTRFGVVSTAGNQNVYTLSAQGISAELTQIAPGEYRATDEGAFWRYTFDGYAAWQAWDPAGTHSGVRVVRLEPSGAQATAPVLKAAVAGSSQAVAAFLEGVPQWLPGVTLHRLELVTQEQGVECRLDLTVPPPPTGGTPA